MSSSNPPLAATAHGLPEIGRIYRFWGHHPLLYAAQDPLTFLGRHRLIRRRAVEALGLAAGARVLEVACGTGRDFPYLEDAIGPRGSLVAFDYSADMLGAAKLTAARHGYRNIRFVQGDAAELAVGDAPFDGVLCVLGMSAMPNHLAALRRCKEVLRPGGRLSVCDARPLSGAASVLNGVLKALYGPTTGWHPDRDVVTGMAHVFGNVETETFNAGTFFVAWAEKRGAGG